MHVLTAGRRSATVLIATLGLLLAAVAPSAGHQPAEPDHGVNESTFGALWSGDADGAVNASADASVTLQAGTDIPFAHPPKAAEQWTRRDLGDLPRTGSGRAVHPTGANTTDGRFLQDVSVAVAGITPSTRARLEPGRQPLYVPPNGTVLGAVDSRVAVPDSGGSWSLVTHEVEQVQLLVDGHAVDSQSGGGPVRLDYTRLTPSPDGNRSFRLRATVFAKLRKERTVTRRRCWVHNGTKNCTTYEVTVTSHHSERLTVSQSVQGTVYELTLSGFRTQYPSGDRGTVVFRNQPWAGITTTGRTVRGVWRFYVSQRSGWEELVVATDSGTHRRHSPVHPVQTHAYPNIAGPTAKPANRTRLLATYGRQYRAPSLPRDVSLAPVEGSYTGSFGLATRTVPASPGRTGLVAHGLVHGTTARFDRSRLVHVPTHATNLTLSVRNRTSDTVTVRVHLHSNRTGRPVETHSRAGYVTVDGRRVNTTADGTATVTVPRRGDAVTARFVPGHWWREMPGYTGDTAVVHTGGSVLRYLSLLYQLTIRAGTLLAAGYLLDRVTQWGFWPPWRGV